MCFILQISIHTQIAFYNTASHQILKSTESALGAISLSGLRVALGTDGLKKRTSSCVRSMQVVKRHEIED